MTSGLLIHLFVSALILFFFEAECICFLCVQIYDEFCPLLLNQFKSRECIKFDVFDYALDEFYSKIESQRSEQQRKAKEESAMQKLDKIRLDQVLST